MTGIVYRTATADDIPHLLVLEQNLIDSERPYDKALKKTGVIYYDLADLIANAMSTLIVAESDNTIAGCGYAQIRESRSCLQHEHHCYLGFIFTEPDHRGAGIAGGILEALKRWGVEQGISHFQLDVYCENKGAIRAYEKAGFTQFTVKMELVV